MKKKIIRIFVIVLLLLTIIFFYPKIRIYFTTNKLTTYDYDKRLRIAYLMIDKNKTKNENVTVANASTLDATISLVNNGVAYLKKDGEYYVGYINDVNDYILDDVPDYSFTYNNLSGQVIEGCFFDLKTRQVKIPVKYYEDAAKEENVQMEIVSRVDKKKFSSLSSHLKISGLKNKKKDITLNGNETTSLISILDYNSKNSITKDEISIYINNDKEKLDKYFYNWNSDAGTIEINLSPILIDNIVVTIDSNIVSYNLLGRAAKADTESYASMDAAGKLASAPTLSVGHRVALTSVPVAYKSDKVYGHPDMVNLYDKINSDNDLYNNCDTTNKTCEKYTSSLDYFAFDLSGTSDSKKVYSNAGDSISFGTHTYVKAYCSSHVTAAESSSEPTMEIRLIVIAISQEDNYVIFKIEPRSPTDNFYTQIPAGVIKLVWDDSYGKIIIKKKLVDQGTTVSIPKNTFGFTLYKDSECKTVKKAQKYINPDYGNTVSWTNLALGTYYVKESKCDSTKYRCDSVCHRVVVSKTDKKRTDSDGNLLYLDTTLYDNPITNYAKKYCVKVKKNDVEHVNNCAVRGIEFTLSDKETSPSYSDKQTTNSNGRVQFLNLKYQNYYLKETSADPTTATLYCNNDKVGDYDYWNENQSSSTITASNLTEMIWNSSSKKYEGCPTEAITNAITKADHKKYYCVALKKIDSITKSPLAGAKFVINNNASVHPQYNSNGVLGSTIVKGNNTVGDGVAYFFLRTTSSAVKIKETVAPSGYAIGAEITATPIAMTKGTKNDGTRGNLSFVENCRAAYNSKNISVINYTDAKYVINWYKENENGKGISGAKFLVRYTDSNSSTHYVIAESAKANHTDASKVTKKCYVYKGFTTDKSKATELVSDSNGETCISGIVDNGKKIYSVEELESAEYHTFGKSKVKRISISSSFTSKDATADSSTNTNKFVNYDTRFEFEKTVSSGDEEDIKIIVNGVEKTLKDLTTEELKLLEFNVTNKDNKVLSFILKDGVYEYVGNIKDKPEGTSTTSLHLDDNRKIIIKHLPKGTYSIKEKNVCDSSDDCDNCVGYYYPDYTVDSSHKFTITNCSNANATSCTTHVSSKQALENKPTEIEFTKKDLYSNVDGNDKVTFEGDDEITAFDEIGFKLKQGQTDITNHLIKVSDGNYRYVKDDLPVSSQLSEIYTKNGTFTITHLCRNTSYTISEDSVPENSIFDVVDKDGNRPSVTFKIDETKPSTKQKAEIVDEPTRVIIEKKDITTNETIQEEKNTNKKNSSIFEVYRCKSDKVCGDTFNIDDVTKITFKELKGTQTDEKRYAYTIDQNDKSNVSELVLTKGRIILRYLPAGFRYYIKEKNAPDGYYKLDDNKVNSFIQETSNLDIKINIGNTPTSITFKKEDIFNYYNSSDQSKINENVKLFDTMRFKLHDKDGNTLKLKCVTKDGKGYNDQTKMCESGVYRYLTYSDTENNISELNTVNGTFTITHLYNNQKYYIEEVKSDDEGNFILPSNKKYKNLPFNNNGHPVVTYNVPETKPVSDDDNSITQLIKNDPTRVVFEKRDSKTNELINDDLTSSNSTKTTFRVYMCDKSVSKCTIDNGTLVYFTDREYVDDNDIDANNRKVKAYKYSKLNSSTNAITDLYTDQGTLIIRYLPSNYKYVIYETVAPSGYYNPTQINGQIEFTVEGTTVSEDKDYEDITEVIQNTPTELIFNKEDLYNYYNSEDITGSNNLTKLFDTMKFKLYNEKGEVLALKCTTVNGKGYNDKTKTCESGEYRYLPVDSKENIMTELNTINGTFKVTHLYRNKKYYIEEIKSDDEGIFILPNYMTFDNLPFDNNGHPVVQYVLPEKKPDSYESVTEVIENIPTRVRLEKRDSKYGYLIDDETTTFNVYACEKSVDKCTKENGKLIYFTERATIKGDKEDDSIEVYKYSKTNTKAISDLHPYHGVLVLRYLPSKYKYVLVETKSPKGYVLPNNENRETEFSVKSETSVVEGIDVPNKATSLLIKKYSDDGKLLPGAEFKIYEGTTCDANVSAMNQPKTLLKLKTIRDGVYENRPTKDTDSVVTCTDREGAKCSDISTTTSTKLTYNDYIKSWANFDNSIDDENNKIELQEGEALIQYLDYNKCYIIEEVKAPKGYSLPKNEEDRYTMITIDEDPSIKTTKKELINRPTTFTFYKYDEYNNLLDGAEFKLQKLDDNKKYQDIAVIKEETENGVYYKADESSDNKIITTVNGSATVYYLEEGQYRIVEVTPAPGKELSKNPNIATFFVDNSGNVYGNSIIVNKSKTEKFEVKSSASAELVVSIQTGQKVIRYGLVIATIVSVIIALMIMLRMYKKQSE